MLQILDSDIPDNFYYFTFHVLAAKKPIKVDCQLFTVYVCGTGNLRNFCILHSSFTFWGLCVIAVNLFTHSQAN
jgi:hypothetical protein